MKFINGLHRDSKPIDQPENTYRDALNIVLSQKYGAVANEKGTNQVANLSGFTDLNILHTLSIGYEVVIFFKEVSGSGIILYDTQDDSYQTIINPTSSLGEKLDFGDFIQAVNEENFKGDKVIYWVDENNPPRYLNLDNVPDSIEKLNLFPSVSKTPIINSVSISDSGGNLKSGGYIIAFSYLTDDNVQTNYTTVSQPIYINTDNRSQKAIGSRSGEQTSKRIIFDLENLDTERKALKVAVVPIIDGVYDQPFPLPEISITSSFQRIIIGGDTTDKLEELSNIQIDNVEYSNAKAINVQDGQLYLGNLSKEEDIGYQKYANKITIEPAIELSGLDYFNEETTLGRVIRTDSENGYRNINVHNSYKGYRREEVYAFYISWLLKNGTESKAYHIPGREASEDDKNFFSYGNLTGEKYQFESSDNSGEMGYWENKDETYPDNDDWDSTDIGGPDLTGENVRHHKFPSAIGESLVGNSPISKPLEYEKLKVMGFKVKNVELPEELKDKVIGYKIYRAQRTSENKTIFDSTYPISSRVEVDKGLLRGTEYSRDNGGISANSETKIHYIHPFNLLDNDNINFVDYIKAVGECDTDISTSDTSSGRTKLHTEAVKQLTFSEVDESDKFRIIEGVAKVTPAEINTITSLIGQGIDKDYDALGSETKFIIQTDEKLFTDDETKEQHYLTSLNNLANDEVDTRRIRRYNLCSFRNNLYNSFDRQILVDTGYIHTNLNNLESSTILGGDTYINFFNFKGGAVRPVGSGTNSHTAFYSYFLESDKNLAMRLAGDRPEDQIYPKASYLQAAAFFLGSDEQYNYNNGREGGEPAGRMIPDNYFEYDGSTSKDNDLKQPKLISKRKEKPSKFPWRIIRSEQSTEEDTNKLRVFRQNNFTDLPKNRGDLIKIAIYNNILIPHMERGILQTKGREQLQVEGIQAFIGAGDIFAVKPDDFIFTDNGFGGIVTPNDSIITPYGYFFIDRNSKRLFNINNEGMVEISNNGLYNYYKNLSMGNSSIGYDPEFRRVLITTGDSTVSYYPELQIFGSFHSYLPDYYFNSYDKLYSIVGSVIHKHGEKIYSGFYEAEFPNKITFVDNRGPNMNKVVRSVQFTTEVFDENNEELLKETFDKFRIYTGYQDSGEKNLLYFDQEIDYITEIPIRRTKRTWFVNKFRDETNIPDGIPDSEKWKWLRRIEDKYCIVTLSYNNINRFFLYDAQVNYKQSIR